MVAAKHLSRRAALALIGAGFVVPSVAATPLVDLALVLAIDSSYSIDPEEYLQQMRGTGQAFLDSKIMEAIARGPNKQIAVAAFLWSDAGHENLIVPWRIIAKPADAISVADVFLSIPREDYKGSTGTGAALLFAQKLLHEAPPSLRRVVDLSTDGTRNTGPEVEPVRDRLVRDGITINGLAIANEVPDLQTYITKSVIGGDGHFVIVARDYNAYTEAIKTKLLREVSNFDII
ncbi:MAG: DUF1194 domain-containing protein [Alphaproteobacteria bacterium]|nr:DUF1194 domain-containing protein [Alphaproteobacteria bacterium]